VTAVVQQQFDDLAKGLATNRLSRRQVLKSLASGLLLAGPLSFLWNGTAPAQASAVRRDPVRVGSCQKLSDYIQKTGVTDEEGKNHETLAGVTTYNCRSRYNFAWQETRSPGRSICVRTTKLRVTFEALGKVTVIDWRPTEPQTAACKREEKRFEDSVVAHEMRHVRDIKAVVAAANRAWRRKPPLKACASTQQKAVSALKQKIENGLDAECARITREIKRKAKAFDDSPAGKLPLHCDRCGCPPAGGATLAAQARVCNSQCCEGPCAPEGGCCPAERVCDGGQVCCPEGLQCVPGTGGSSSCSASTKIYCNCNDTCYDDVQVCLSECKVTLGCFTAICAPAKPGQCPA
jgi:hypothetical protein